MNEPLGRVEDLPPDYYHGLRTRNTLPLWPSLRGFLPYGAPIRRTQPTMWRYRDIRPDVIRAGELAPIEKAERRVIVLCNPGLGIDSMMATPSIYIGLQLILPRETAPNHRHTPSAIRFVIEGEGGFTVVGGEKLPMEKGDLILTPSGLWHEHGHEGSGPVVWLDALDLPLIYMLEASCAVEGPSQVLDKPLDFGSARYRQGGVVPYASLDARPNDYPLLRFPWRDVKETLAGLARITAVGAPVHLAYVNPETGRECLPTLGFSVLMLRPGEEIQLARRSCSAVLHIVEGEGTIVIDEAEYRYLEADTLAVPTHSQIRFLNASTSRPSYVFVVDDAPLQRKLGIYSADVVASVSR